MGETGKITLQDYQKTLLELTFLYSEYMIIDGKKIAFQMYENLKSEIQSLKRKPVLTAVLVGNNSSSLRYINQKKKWAEHVGIEFKLIRLDKTVQEKERVDI